MGRLRTYGSRFKWWRTQRRCIALAALLSPKGPLKRCPVIPPSGAGSTGSDERYELDPVEQKGRTL